MSTKIYNGFKLNFAGNFSELRKDLMQMSKSVIKPKVIELFNAVLANMVYTEFDTRLFEANKDWDSKTEVKVSDFSGAYVEAWHKLCGRIQDIGETRYRDTLVDFEFSIVLFPMANKMLGIPFTSNRELEKLWFRRSDVEQYGYWNNTDPPEDVTEEEWDARGAEWDEALGESGIPAESGFTFQFVEPGFMHFPKMSEISDVRPSIEDRVTWLVKEEIFRLALEAVPKDSELEKELQTGRYTAIMEAKDLWYNSDQGKKISLELPKQVEALIRAVDEQVYYPKPA